MRARSWMAALALLGASSILIGRGLSAQGPGHAQEASPSKPASNPKSKSAAAGEPREASPRSPKSAKSDGKLPTIQLDLAIAGLGAAGCDVEVKPANASCKFRPSPTKHVSSDGRATVELRDIELRGADKTCAVAITVREPGQPPQTIYRGYRTVPTKPGSTPSYWCYINSRLASVAPKATRK